MWRFNPLHYAYSNQWSRSLLTKQWKKTKPLSKKCGVASPTVFFQCLLVISPWSATKPVNGQNLVGGFNPMETNDYFINQSSSILGEINYVYNHDLENRCNSQRICGAKVLKRGHLHVSPWRHDAPKAVGSRPKILKPLLLVLRSLGNSWSSPVGFVFSALICSVLLFNLIVICNMSNYMLVHSQLRDHSIWKVSWSECAALSEISVNMW